MSRSNSCKEPATFNDKIVKDMSPDDWVEFLNNADFLPPVNDTGDFSQLFDQPSSTDGDKVFNSNGAQHGNNITFGNAAFDASYVFEINGASDGIDCDTYWDEQLSQETTQGSKHRVRESDQPRTDSLNTVHNNAYTLISSQPDARVVADQVQPSPNSLGTQSTTNNLYANTIQDRSAPIQVNSNVTASTDTVTARPSQTNTGTAKKPKKPKKNTKHQAAARLPKEHDQNGNYVDSRIVNVDYNHIDELSRAEIVPASRIRVKLRDPSGKITDIDLNQIGQQGFTGKQFFRCPVDTCDKIFVRRHCVVRHFNGQKGKPGAHPKEKARGVTAYDHATLASYNWNDGRGRSARGPRNNASSAPETFAEMEEGGDDQEMEDVPTVACVSGRKRTRDESDEDTVDDQGSSYKRTRMTDNAETFLQAWQQRGSVHAPQSQRALIEQVGGTDHKWVARMLEFDQVRMDYEVALTRAAAVKARELMSKSKTAKAALDARRGARRPQPTSAQAVSRARNVAGDRFQGILTPQHGNERVNQNIGGQYMANEATLLSRAAQSNYGSFNNPHVTYNHVNVPAKYKESTFSTPVARHLNEPVFERAQSHENNTEASTPMRYGRSNSVDDNVFACPSPPVSVGHEPLPYTQQPLHTMFDAYQEPQGQGDVCFQFKYGVGDEPGMEVCINENIIDSDSYFN